MKIGIFEENFSQKLKDILANRYSIVFFNDNMEEFLCDVDVIFIRLKNYIGKDILKKAPNLKYICSPTTGWNHIDIDEVSKRGIELISLKGEFDFLNEIRATPEHTFGLALSLLRNYKELFLKYDSSWSIRNNSKGYELYGNSAGIIGYGRVGKILANYLTSFGCSTKYYDIKDIEEPNSNITKEVSMEALIENSNIVFLCASYSDDNLNLLGEKNIDLLKDKFFINTSRGELIDELYLIDKIKKSWFKGVALDVISNENAPNNLDEFLSIMKTENLIITPHIAGATYESMEKTDLFILDKLSSKTKESQK